MPTVKLVGADDATCDTEGASSYIIMGRFQCGTTGTITEFKQKVDRITNIKLAIYADNAGSPAGLLVVNNTGQACAVGWNTLTIPSLAVTSGTWYWLAINVSTASTYVFRGVATATTKYKVWDYATNFPDPAGAGYTDNVVLLLAAGWGNEPAVGPANLKTYNTNLKANIKTINQNLIANCKTLDTNA